MSIHYGLGTHDPNHGLNPVELGTLGGKRKDKEELMKGKRKSAAAVGRAGSSKADLGQKEARLEKKQAELEEASEAQLRHMEGGKDANAASRQKAKIQSD
jgi:hypothetical protein